MPADPCGREEEAAAMRAHISESVENNAHGLLYVSGMPGSGKTHTCRKVLAQLQDTFAGVQVVFLNCGALSRPGDLFLTLHGALRPNVSKSSPREVQVLLRSEKYTVIMADEVDMLITGSRQHTLYNFLELPQICKNVYIVCISNTYNIPCTSMQHKIRSRLGWNRLNFPMYQKKHIAQILRETEDPHKLTAAATDLCAAKVAAISGDIRKAFEIRKVAARLADKKGARGNRSGKAADIAEVEVAIRIVFHSVHNSFVHSLSPLQRQLLISVAKLGVVSQGTAYEDLLMFLGARGEEPPNLKFHELQEVIEDMIESGILRKKQSKGRSMIWTEYISEEVEMILGEGVSYEGVVMGRGVPPPSQE